MVTSVKPTSSRGGLFAYNGNMTKPDQIKIPNTVDKDLYMALYSLKQVIVEQSKEIEYLKATVRNLGKNTR